MHVYKLLHNDLLRQFHYILPSVLVKSDFLFNSYISLSSLVIKDTIPNGATCVHDSNVRAFLCLNYGGL